MADAIARLLRLRAAEADAARRSLAKALHDKDLTTAQVEDAADALEAETRMAPRDLSHPLAGAFAAWLPAGHQAIARAQADNAATEAALATARNALTEARLAVRACETFAEVRKAATRAAALGREQVLLEDVSRRSRRSG